MMPCLLVTIPKDSPNQQVPTLVPAITTEDIKESALTLVTSNADHIQLQDSFVTEVDKICFDMDTKTEATEAHISTKVQEELHSNTVSICRQG
eukprot:scaffold49562_cov52-Attheya_sp.AAC.2